VVQAAHQEQQDQAASVDGSGQDLHRRIGLDQ